MAGEQMERLARCMFDKDIAQHVKGLCCRWQVLRGNYSAVWWHGYERKAPANCEIHVRNAAVRSIHGRENVQILRQGKFWHSINGVRQLHFSRVRTANFGRLEKIDRFAENFTEVGAINFIDDKHEWRILCSSCGLQ